MRTRRLRSSPAAPTAVERGSPLARIDGTATWRYTAVSTIPSFNMVAFLLASQSPRRPLAARSCWEATSTTHAASPTCATTSLLALGRQCSRAGNERLEELRLLLGKYFLMACQCAPACFTLFRNAFPEDRSGVSPADDCSRWSRRRDLSRAAHVEVGASIQDGAGSLSVAGVRGLDSPTPRAVFLAGLGRENDGCAVATAWQAVRWDKDELLVGPGD
jgi:hypothetical protein